MQGPSDLGHLKTREWQRLQDLADGLEKAWEQDGAGDVDLNRFLPASGDPLRNAALIELIKTDMEIRWRRGQLVGLEAYLEQFPELGNNRTLAPELIYEEYRVRQLYGDKPPLAKYKARFPAQYPRLTEMLAEQPVPTGDFPSSPAAAPAGTAGPKGMPAANTGIPGTATPTAPSGSTVPGAPTGQGQLLSVGGGYKLIKRIGSGSFGEVWKGEAPGGVECAVKIILRPLDHEEAQREKQSLDLIKQLRHPFLAATQTYWPMEDRLYIVMELAEGSLRDRAKKCRADKMPGIPLAELFTYFKESAEALDYLHQQHVQHRDIKPENILIMQGHAKLADFGLAKMMQSQRMVASATTSGTPMYMAPEVWSGKVSEHSDQYSLACSYTELRLNRRLFDATDLIGIMRGHMEMTPKLDPLSDAEQKVLLKAMSKDPAQRYESCMEFLRELEKALAPELRSNDPNMLFGTGDMGDMADGSAGSFGTMTLGTGVGRRGMASRTALTALGTSQAWRPLAHPYARATAAVAVCVAVVALGWLGWEKLLRPGTVALEKPAAVTINADETVPLRLHIHRDRFKGEVKLTFSGLPNKVEIEPSTVTIPAGADNAEVKIKADAGADAGESDVTVQTEKGDKQVLKLTVNPLATLPDGFQKASDEIVTAAATGKKYYKWISVTKGDITKGEIPVEFRVIPQEKESDPATFYIMKTKVWNDLFGLFAEEHRAPLDPKTEWRDGGQARETPNSPWKKLGIEKRGKYPVFRVRVLEAHEFAKWLGGLLPTPAQWDRAAGCYEGGSGPFQGAAAFDPKKDPPEAAVRREKEGPIEVGSGTRDVSPFECRDMAGNGMEWTRETNKGPVPVAKPDPDTTVVLRGRSYLEDDKDPLRYLSANAYKTKGIPSEQPQYLDPSQEVSFRVVVEPR